MLRPNRSKQQRKPISDAAWAKRRAALAPFGDYFRSLRLSGRWGKVR